MSQPTGTGEQIPWNGIFAVIGVIIGFLLSQLAEALKHRSRKDSVRKKLNYELVLAKKALSEGLAGGSRLTYENFPLVTDSYISLAAELVAILDPPKLAAVQKAYQRIDQVNKPGWGHLVVAGDGVIFQRELQDDIDILDEAIKALNKEGITSRLSKTLKKMSH